MSHLPSSSTLDTASSKIEHGGCSPKILRKRPQSVSLARVLVYDGGGAFGGETSSSNNSLNSETAGTARRNFQLHHGSAAATSEEEAAFRKLNLGSTNPIFGSVSGSHHRNYHHLYSSRVHNHHSSLTIPSRGGSTDASAVSETNLIRVRSSALGKSAPSLSQSMVSTAHVDLSDNCLLVVNDDLLQSVD